MKKIIALALSLMLLLGCVSALAEAADKQTITMLGAFTITTDKLPEGYTLNVVKNSEMEYEALIASPEAGKPYYVLLMNFSDEWADVDSLANATEEDMAAVKDSFYEVTEMDDGDITFEDGVTGEGTPLLIAKASDGSFGAVYAIYKSHEIEVDIEDVLGHYIQAEVKNSSYTNEEGLTKSVQYVNRPARAECFPNGKPSLYEEIVNKRKSKTNRASASVEEPASDKQEDTVDLLKEWGL